MAEAEEKACERNPDMELAQELFLLANKCENEDLVRIHEDVMQKIEQKSVCVRACVRVHVCVRVFECVCMW